VLVHQRSKSFNSSAVLLGLSISVLLSIPVKTANYDFRHFNVDEGLTISFSKSAPPLAALEDERLPVVQTEPTQEFIVEKGSIALIAGVNAAWPKLKRYARFFAHISQKSISHKSYSANANDTNITSINDLTKLVVAVPAQKELVVRPKGPMRLLQVRALTEIMSEPKADIKKIQLAQANPTIVNDAQNSVRTIRDEVEEPLKAPAVMRSLPTGEEAPPKIVDPQLKVIIPNTTSEKIADTKKSKVSEPESSSDQIIIDGPSKKDVWRIAALNQPKAPEIHKTNDASSNDGGKKSDTSFLTDEKVNDQLFAKKVDEAPTPAVETTQEISHKIVGRVELMGGLAATGNSTKLDIQWKTGNHTRPALVDYSTGEFVIETPTLQAGKIIATLIDDTTRVLGRGDFDLTDVGQPGQRMLEGVKIIIEPQNSLIKGQIFSAYSVDENFIPVKEAELFAPAAVREVADAKGNFRLGGLSSDSTFFLDGYAPDHWGTRVMVEGNQKPRVPVFSEKMLQSFFDITGHSANNTELGVIWGKVKRKGKPIAGVSVGLSSPDAIGPIYFNALHIPDKNMRATSDNGLYAFIKVKPGLHVVMSQIQNQELPSTVVSVAPTMVSYAEINMKVMQIQGRVYDPVKQQTVQAQVSVVGTSKTAVSGQNGFNLKIPSTDPVLFVDANAGPEYFISREAVARTQSKKIDMYMFKKSWLSDQFRNMGLKYDEQKGIILGYVNGPAFHVALDSKSSDSVNENTLYFDNTGKIQPDSIEGVAGGGGFIITNLKPGVHTLVITSAEGEIVASRIFVSEAGVLNVLSMPLRP